MGAQCVGSCRRVLAERGPAAERRGKSFFGIKRHLVFTSSTNSKKFSILSRHFYGLGDFFYKGNQNVCVFVMLIETLNCTKNNLETHSLNQPMCLILSENFGS